MVSAFLKPHSVAAEKEKDSGGKELWGQVFSTVPSTYVFPHLQYFRNLHAVGPRRLVNKETGEKPQSFQSTKPRHRNSEWESHLAWQLSLPDLGSGFQSLSKGFTSSDGQMASAKETLRVGPSPISTLSARSFSGSSCR